jgi:hypothetical protein
MQGKGGLIAKTGVPSNQKSVTDGEAESKKQIGRSTFDCHSKVEGSIEIDCRYFWLGHRELFPMVI